MSATELSLPDVEPVTPQRHRADAWLLGAEIAFVALATAIGAVLTHRGVKIHAEFAPLQAHWRPHVGIGTPLAVGVALLVVFVRTAAWSWTRLLIGGYLATAGWIFALALIDGWQLGIARRIPQGNSFGPTASRVTDVHQLLSTFTDHILARQPGSWSTDVAGHPPGALLVFVGLDRLGLRGGGFAGAATILIGALASICVAITIRALGDEAAARTALPFLILFPGAVWVGTSADGLFMGVAAAGVALIVLPGWWRAAIGGLLLGYALYLSYGLVLFGLVALVALWLKPIDRLRSLLAAVAGFVVVVAAFTAGGFWWLDGYHLVKQRYYQGWGAERPYSYWVWADLACLVLCAGPILLPALRRTFAAGQRAPLRWLPLAAGVAVLGADLSGLSKGEVERIWLPFAIWLVAGAALLPQRYLRAWLIGQAVLALVINSLLLTAW